MTVSVIIPVYNGASTLEICLKALGASTFRDFEIIVVDDGSSDGSAELAQLSTAGRQGPAFARNLGARSASGDILMFVDADVLVHPNTLETALRAFERDPSIDAVIGAYDDEPAERNFLSQYKNLMHCYIHRQGKQRASTFWTGCGAIRKSVFDQAGGFDERYRRPSIEDIELGARLTHAGFRIELDPAMMVKHLKRWTLGAMLKSDIFDRAIPWTELMLGRRHMPADLNLQWSQRAGVALVLVSPVLAAYWWPAACCALVVTLALNRGFYKFLIQKRGVLFAIRAVPLHLLYFAYSGVSFALGALRFVILPKHAAKPL
jgi:glycosyltransferase involved in cell wall biosynthesis